MPREFVKDPGALKDYIFDWTTWIGADTITGTPVITVPTGITLASQSNTAKAVTVWLSGGTTGQTYQVACKITTAGARVDPRTIKILIEPQ